MIARLYKDLDQNGMSISDLSDKGYWPGMKDEAIQAFLDDEEEKIDNKADKKTNGYVENEKYGSDDESHASV